MNVLLAAAVLSTFAQVTTADRPLAETPAVSASSEIQTCGLFSRRSRPQPRRTTQRPAAPRPAQQRPAAQPAMIPADEAVRAARRMFANMADPDLPWDQCGYDKRGELKRSFELVPPLPADARASVSRLHLDAFRQYGGLFKELAAEIEKGRTELLRAGVRDGRRVVYFTFMGEDVNSRYYALLAARRGSAVVFEDVYVAAQLTWFSEYSAMLIDIGLTEVGDATVAGEARRRSHITSQQRRIRHAYMNEQAEVGEELLAEQSEEFRSSLRGRYSALRLQFNRVMRDEADIADFYVEAKQLLEEHPNEPEVIDLYFVAACATGDRAAVLEAHELMSEVVGEHAIHCVRTGNQLTLVGTLSDAAKFYDRALRLSRDDARPSLHAADYLAASGFTAEAIERLRIIDRNFVLNWSRLGFIVHCEDLVGTPEHEEFLKYLGDRAPEAPTQVAQPDEGTFRL